MLREFQSSDYESVVELWAACGLHPSRSDRAEAIARKLERDPDLFLVVEEEGRVIASVMGTYDGRRGWVNRLCVNPAERNRALGKLLMSELENRLRNKGCEKVNLLIEMDNKHVVDFYKILNYTKDDLIFMEKWILEK